MRAFFFLASRFRPILIFPLLRTINKLHRIRAIVDLFDPNLISKHRKIKLSAKLHKFKLNRCTLVVDLNDHIGYWTYILNEPFEQSVYKLGKKLNVSKDDIVLDIGANIGTASIPICVESGCELIAVEASKPNAALLLQNAGLNGIRMQAHILALTSPDAANRFIPLYLREGNTGANSLLASWTPSAGDRGHEIVFARTLDDILSDEAVIQRIKIVKIDVEGAEWAVVQGATQFLARNRAPILMEYRFDAMDEKLAAEFAQLIEFMIEHYDICGLDGEGRQVKFDFHGSYENILFTRRAAATDVDLAARAAS